MNAVLAGLMTVDPRWVEYNALHAVECSHWKNKGESSSSCNCGMSAAIRALASDDPLSGIMALLAREEEV